MDSEAIFWYIFETSISTVSVVLILFSPYIKLFKNQEIFYMY